MKIATICFPIRDNMLYLANKKKSFGIGLLNGWGGKAKNGESIPKAACREFGEEGKVKILPEDIELVAILNFFKGAESIFECHVFFLKDWKGEIQETEEMGAPEPYPIDNIPYDLMWKGDRQWLPLLIEGKKVRAAVVYDLAMENVETFEWQPL